MNGEYTVLSLEELIAKAMDVRVDSGPLLMEARRRDDVPRSAREKLEELAAVTGKKLTYDWTIVGVPFLSAGDVELAVCIRLKAAVGIGRMTETMQESVPELRLDGGSGRDKGRESYDE